MSDMILTVGKEKIELKTARFFGVFENYGVMTWYLELSTEDDEKNSVLLNSLDFDEKALPGDINGMVLDLPEEGEELFEHAFTINELDRYPETLRVEVKNWDAEKSTFEVNISGVLEEDEEEKLAKEEYSFSGVCQFTGLNLVETNEELVDEFVEQKMKTDISKVEHSFDEIATGMMCKIKGPF